MKLQFSFPLVVCLFVVAFLIHPRPVLAQATITCPSGQWDMVDVMTMDQSLINANYHLAGTHTDFTTGATSAVYDKPFLPSTNTGSGGKLYYVKSFQRVTGLSANPNDPSGLYGYPWDINLYDSNYAYLWITEQSVHDHLKPDDGNRGAYFPCF